MPCYDPKSVLIFILIVIVLLFLILFLELGHRSTLASPNICESTTVLPPTNFASSPITNGTIVSWTGSVDDANYRVYIGSVANFDISGQVPINTINTEYLIPISTNDVYIKVSAVDINGCTSPTVPVEGYRVVGNVKDGTVMVLTNNGNYVDTSSGNFVNKNINANFKSYLNTTNKWIFNHGQLQNGHKCLINSNGKAVLGLCNDKDRWTVSNNSGHVCLKDLCLSSDGFVLKPFDSLDQRQKFSIDTRFALTFFKIVDKMTNKHIVYTGIGPVYAYTEEQLKHLGGQHADSWVTDRDGCIYPVLNNVKVCLGIVDDCVCVSDKFSNKWTMEKDCFLRCGDRYMYVSPHGANVMVDETASAFTFIWKND